MDEWKQSRGKHASGGKHVLSGISPKALELNCNAELQNLFSWCAANKLQVNPKKSFAIIIPPKINAASIDLNLGMKTKKLLVASHQNTLA